MNTYDAGAATIDHAEYALLAECSAEVGSSWPPDAARVNARPAALREASVRIRAAQAKPAAIDIRWTRFLDSLTEPAVGLSQSHARAVRQVWHELACGVGPGLPYPAAGPEEDGAVTLVWSTDAYVAEVTVHPDGRHEWFFRNHLTGAFEGTEQAVWGGPHHRFYDLLTAALRA